MVVEVQDAQASQLNAQSFIDEGLSHEIQLPMTVDGLTDVIVPMEEKPYQHALALLQSKRGPEKVMVDAGLVVAALARSFEDTRSEVEVRCIEPFFRKIQAALETAGGSPEVQRYSRVLKELLDQANVSEMSSEASSFASRPYATPQGFYSTPKAAQMGLDKFFRALRWLGMAGHGVDSQAQDQEPYDFDLETMKEIRQILLDNPELLPGLESFSLYSTSLAGQADSVSMRMIDLPRDADEEAIAQAVRESAASQGIPKIAAQSGIPFTVLETAYTATQAAYEGVQQLGDVASPSVEQFAEATNVMRAYLGGDPAYPEVGGVLNEIPENPTSAYEFMLAMAASLSMDDPALALNRFATTETTAAEAVVGLEKQQMVRFRGMSAPSVPNELHLDPSITQAFLDRGSDVAQILSDVAEANGVDAREFPSFVKLSGILRGVERMLGKGSKMLIDPEHAELELGKLKALFDQDPTAAIKVAEYGPLVRVNMALPMTAKRTIGPETFTYLSTLFGSVVQQVEGAGDLLTRQKLLEMRQRGEQPDGVEFMVSTGSQDDSPGGPGGGGEVEDKAIPATRSRSGFRDGGASRGGGSRGGGGNRWPW